MSVISIYSPPELDNTSLGVDAVSQFIANPFGTRDNPASPVWIQCTPTLADFGGGDITVTIGILQVTYVDNDGQVQNTQFGDVNDIAFNLSVSGEVSLPKRLYYEGFISAEILLLGYHAAAQGIVTLYLWG